VGYVLTSTNNPLGRKPWNFSTSNSGLSRYDQEQFVIPGVTTGNPLTDPLWTPFSPSPASAGGRAGMGRYNKAQFVIPTNTVLNPEQAPAWTPPGLGKYYGSSFPVPMGGILSRGQLGDYEVDPATLPPAPAGMQYNAQYELVPIPKPNYTPYILLGLAAVGGAAWWYYKGGGKKMLTPKPVALPVMPAAPAIPSRVRI
jgi:hypothetical protein